MAQPTWQDYLMQFGPELGTIAGQFSRPARPATLGTPARKGGPEKSPFQQQMEGVSWERADPSIGAGIDTPALNQAVAEGPYGNTETMSINKPEAYTPTGEGMMSSGAPSPTEGMAGAQPTGGGIQPDFASIASTLLNLYGIAKSGGPNEMRGELEKAYGKDAGPLPDAPHTASRTHQAAHTIGTTALGMIPVVGPFAQAAGGALGEAKATGDYSDWYHKLMAANPALHKPKMETPHIGLGRRDKIRKGLQAVGGAAASYFGGPLGGAAAGLLHGASDRHFAEQRERQARKIGERNQRYAENAARATQQMGVRDEAVRKFQEEQGGGGGGGGGDFGMEGLDPQTQALLMLLGGQA